MLSDYSKNLFKGGSISPFISPFLFLTVIILSLSCQKSEELNGEYANCKNDSISSLQKDPLLAKQWTLDSSNHNIAKENASANIVEAWKRKCLGQNIIIAIIDNGTEISHPEFQDKLILPGNTDFVDSDNDPSPDSSSFGFYHGTEVAGVAAAGDNGFGILGVAPRAKILPIRLIYDLVQDSEIASAFYYADKHGADIINNSWGPQDNVGAVPITDVLDYAIKDLSKNGRNGKGMIFVWSSGNGNESVSNDGYAAHPDVITVGASDDQGNKAWYSDYGPEVLTVSPSSGGLTSGVWTSDTEIGGANAAPVLKAGNYLLKVIAKQGAGSYTLNLGKMQSGVLEENENIENEQDNSTGQTVSYPVVLHGRIDSLDDIDLYRFTVSSGNLEVSLELNQYQDLDLAIYDDNDVLLFEGKNDTGENENYYSGLYTNSFGGTSAAAPLLSGVIALLLSYNSNLTLSNIRWILKKSAAQEGLNDSLYPFKNGFSEGFGYGRIDADIAFQYVDNPETLGNSTLRNKSFTNVKKSVKYLSNKLNLKSNPLLYYLSKGKQIPVNFKSDEIVFPYSSLEKYSRKNRPLEKKSYLARKIKSENPVQTIYITNLINIAINKAMLNSSRKLKDFFNEYELEIFNKISPQLYLVKAKFLSIQDSIFLSNRLTLDSRIIFAQPDFLKKYKLH